MKKKLSTIVFALVCAIACVFGLVACNSGDGTTVNVESITLDKTTLTLEIDETETLTATVLPDNATNKSVVWKSSAPNIASVDNAGKVTAKTAGSATVSATAGDKKAECVVTVNAAQTKMTEQEWQASLTAFATAKNFRLTLSVVGITAGEVKMSGDTYYDKGGHIERIFVKNENKYYRYDKLSAESDWTKAETTETTYNNIVNVAAYNLVMGGSQALGAGYTSFDYSDGKYTASTISVTTGFTLKDIEVTVISGTVKKIVCTQVGTGENPDTLVTIDEIGTTEITLPKIKEPTKGIQYRIPKNKDYAEVTKLIVTADTDMNIMIAAEYQGKPVTNIADSAFSGDYITSVIIPDSVTNIGTLAFSGCTKLETITIPDSVTSIGSSAFKNTAWFNNQPDGLVYAGKVAYAYKGDKTQLKSITIADGTKSIAPLAFHECEYLTDAVIPDSVKSIGGQAFYECIRLKNITIGSGVESIGNQAFRNCALEHITIPENVTEIGSWVFAGMTIRTINYNGTQEQWAAIKKDRNWNWSEEGELNFTIHCTDGDIKVS